MSFENDKNRTKIRGSKFFILVRLGNCEFEKGKPETNKYRVNDNRVMQKLAHRAL